MFNNYQFHSFNIISEYASVYDLIDFYNNLFLSASGDKKKQKAIVEDYKLEIKSYFEDVDFYNNT